MARSLIAFAAAAAAAAATAAAAAAVPETFTLHLLDSGAFPMAQCLDGSAGGFYFQPGSGSGATQWVVHSGLNHYAFRALDHPRRSPLPRTCYPSPSARACRPAYILQLKEAGAYLNERRATFVVPFSAPSLSLLTLRGATRRRCRCPHCAS